MVLIVRPSTSASTSIMGRLSILTLATSTGLVLPLLSTRSTLSPADSSERYRVLFPGVSTYRETGPALTLKGRGLMFWLPCTSPSTRKRAWDEQPVSKPSLGPMISQVSTQTLDPVPIGLTRVTLALAMETVAWSSA